MLDSAALYYSLHVFSSIYQPIASIEQTATLSRQAGTSPWSNMELDYTGEGLNCRDVIEDLGLLGN